MGKKVYGVVRSGGNKKDVICEVVSVENYGNVSTSPGIATKKKAVAFANKMYASFGVDGFIYTVFKMKFKENI